MDQSAISQLEMPSRLRAEFYFDEDHNRELCKIWVVGNTSNILKKVTPEVIAQFPREWEVYQKTKGEKPDEAIEGTPLREIPGVSRDAAAVLRYKAVRTVEEFAGLDEQTVRDFGPGFLEFWRSAKNLLAAREADELRAMLAEMQAKKRGPGRPRKDESEPEQAELPDNAA